jgi:imidazolonepropionase-like amidohydrolase
VKLLSHWLLCVFFLASPWSTASVLIKDVRVVSPGSPDSDPVDVFIEGGIIRDIGDLPERADQVIEERGRFLTPGLIDSHVHLEGVPGESPDMPQAIREEALRQIPRSYLYFGFTAVLDLFGFDSLTKSWNTQPLAPTAYHCAGAPVPGGYPLAWTHSEDQLQSPAAKYYLYDPHQPELMAATKGSDQHKPRPLVERIAQTNARCIKIFYETGFGRLKDLPVPSPDIVRQLVAAAHEHRLPVYLHGNSQEAYTFALETGVDMLVHGLWRADSEQAADLAERVADANLPVQPTMQVIFGERTLFDPEFFASPDVAHAMPSALVDWYRSDAGQWMAHQMAEDLGPVDGHHWQGAAQRAFAKPIDTLKVFIASLIQKNGVIVFGSDTPSGPIYTQFPGINGRLEMQRWLDAGVSAERLFDALTLDNAEVLGLENTIGTVEVGKRADLLLLEQNPRENASAWDTIEWVIVKGRPVKREMLSASRLSTSIQP